MKVELIATTAFGLEAVTRREIEALGFKITNREDGRLTYIGNEAAIAKSNLWLRTADRVLIKMGEFNVSSFEDLFQGMKGIPWETLIPEDGNFVVNANSVRSKLSSVPACQSVAEKALIERLSMTYGKQRFSKTGASFNVKIRLLKDICTVTCDTSGAGLHKRGYRKANIEAPIKETLAAALVSLSFWKPGRIMADPFCGSGTIAIEAALIGQNIAPGLSRSFASESWAFIGAEVWKRERAEAYKAMNTSSCVQIYASDISKKAIDAAKENAEKAGVTEYIDFSVLPFSEFSEKAPELMTLMEPKDPEKKSFGGVIVCNPPYGERIGEKEQLERIYREIKIFFKENPTWSLFLITNNKEFEQQAFGRPADRRRKLYNGRIETTFYQYHGAKI